jgi:glucose-6-phosphate isomerase
MAASARTQLQLDSSGVTRRRVGARHGLSDSELSAAMKQATAIVRAVEKERRRGAHRYRDLPFDAAMLRAVSAAVRKHRARTDNLVVLGIGGSALGDIALQTALNGRTYNVLDRKRRGGPRLFVMDNVDPTTFAAGMDLIEENLDRTLVNVISKSGQTAETTSQFLIVRDLLMKRLGRDAARKRILVTTDPNSGTMRRIVDSEGYESLPVPDGVGGRFSVLSAVGLFSAGMCGIDIRGLLRGAAAMNERVKRPTAANPAALLAAIHHLYTQKGKSLHVMMPYSDQLRDLADWYRQLWAESLGKRFSADGKREVFAGATPINALGATDQHSQVQLYREGPNDKVITLLSVDRLSRDVKIPRSMGEIEDVAYLGGATLGTLLAAELRATEMALLASERPCLKISFPRITAETVGQFIYLYEAATTIMGRLMGVDPYDQPGVELGKKLTFHFMGRPGYETMPRD